MIKAGQHQAPMRAGIDPNKAIVAIINPFLSPWTFSSSFSAFEGSNGLLSLGKDQVPSAQSSSGEGGTSSFTSLLFVPI